MPDTDLPLQQQERHALCDLALEVGPDHPTLCEGWTAFDLLAHLYVRERKPVAGLGIAVSAVSSWHDHGIEKAKDRLGFPEVVRLVRSGPPLLWKPFDAAANTVEYAVHHEDLRRGAGDADPRPEAQVTELEADLWGRVPRTAKLMTRKLGDVGLVLERPDGEAVTVREGSSTVRIVGRPLEIVLYLFGRRAAAQVDLAGDDDAVSALLAADLGI